MVNGIGSEQLTLITENIWSSMLGIKLSPSQNAPKLGKKMSACVQIVGEWDGAVRLDCSEELVRLAASTCMGIAPEELNDRQISDTAGELANMTGGNLKNLLPKPSSLSLPSVAQGANFTLSVPHSNLVLESVFTHGSSALIVSVFERA